MPVERNKDGSITIRSKNGCSSVMGVIKGGISRIGDCHRDERFKGWAEKCAGLVNACSHTVRETEQHFLGLCDALPLAADDLRMKSFQHNVIMNHFRDKLDHRPRNFSFDMSDEEIEKWHEEDMEMHYEVRNTSPERFGLVLRGYYLPHTERNEIFYEQARKRQDELRAFDENREAAGRVRGQAAPIEQHDICFFFEETTGHSQASGGGEDILQQLLIYRGVTEDDIKKRSPRFLAYISALRDMGKLPTA